MSKVCFLSKKYDVFLSFDSILSTTFLSKPSHLCRRGHKFLATSCNGHELRNPSREHYRFSSSMTKLARKQKMYEMADYSRVQMLKLNKVAIVGKTTRYAFERQRYQDLTDEQFEKKLRSRGSSFDKLLKRHKMHKQVLEKIVSVLKRRNISYEVISRWDLNDNCLEQFEWADAIVTAGGDGTFLSTASKITSRDKPIIGINTDPQRSEGHLCLPAQCAADFDKVLDQIQNNKFNWLFRTRLRITMKGPPESYIPLQNGEVLQAHPHDDTLLRPYNYMGAIDDIDDSYLDVRPPRYSERATLPSSACKSPTTQKALPILALNEIFFGELLASVPTYYEMQVDGEKLERQKSSGICISTGTGSTAWSHNICTLHKETVRKILNIISTVENKTADQKTQSDLLDRVVENISSSYLFPPSDKNMLFSVRDPMQNNVYTCRNPRGFCNTLTLRSRCWDAALSIDGSTSFTFNDGASATISVHPEDELRTVTLHT